MSYCKREGECIVLHVQIRDFVLLSRMLGKDRSVFVTKEDADKPAVMADLVDDDAYGPILPDGSINWDCPCLGAWFEQSLHVGSQS